MATIANLLIKIAADVKGALPELDKLPAKLKDIGGKMDSIGKKMTVGLTLPLAAVGAAALKMSTDFNGAMANVATLIPGSTARVLELKGAVQQMAITTGKSTTDLAGGLYQVISAFGDGADTAKKLEINAKAAAAGLATTTDAINLTSAVTKGYGDTSAAAVQKASDLAFQTVKLGQTTFPELAGSIGRVVPLAAALSIKQEELFGVMATGTGVTGGAAEVSTQLRGVLQSLLAPTDNAAKLMKAMGFANGEAMIKQLGLQGSITALTQAAQKSGQPLQTFIGSIEGQTLALALAGPQAGTLTQKMQAMQGVAGETDKAFREQTQGINKAGFAWSQLQQKLAVTAQRLGDELAPVVLDTMEALKPMIDGVMGLVRAFGQMDPAAKRIVIGVVALVAAIGPMLIAAGNLALALGVLIPLFTATGGAAGGAGIGLKILSVGTNVASVALKAMLGPIGVIAIGLGIIAAKAKETNEEWGKALERQEESLGRVGSAVSNATKIWTQFSKGVKISAVDAKQGAVGLRLLASEATDPAMAKSLREKATALLQYAEAAAKAAGKAGGKVTAPALTIPSIDFGGGDKGESPAEKIKKILEELPKQLASIKVKESIFGKAFDEDAERASALQQAISGLIENGLKKGNKDLDKWSAQWASAQAAVDAAKKATEAAKTAFDSVAFFKDLGAQLDQAGVKAQAFGTLLALPADQAQDLKKAMEELISAGFKPGSKEFQHLQAIAKSLNIDLATIGGTAIETKDSFASLRQSASDVFSSISALKEGFATIAEAFGVELSAPMMKAVTSLGAVGSSVLQVATAIPVLIPQLVALGGALWTALGPIGVIVAGLAVLAAGIYLVWKAFQDDTVPKAMEGLSKSMADINAQSAVMGDSFDRDGAVIKAYESTLIDLAKSGKQNSSEFKALKRTYDDLKASAKETAEMAERLKAAIDLSATLVITGSFVDKLKGKLAEATQDFKDYQEAWRTGDGSAVAGIYAAKEEMKRLNKEVSIGSSLMSGMGSALQGAIKNFLMGTGNLTRGLKEGIKEAIISAITEAAMQGAIVKGAFGGLLEQLTQGLANGSDVSGIIAQIGQQIPQVAQQLAGALAPLRGAIKGFGRAPAMAAGGIVMGPTMALVGEGSSDEAVLPLNDSTFQRMGAAIASAMPLAQAQVQQGGNTYVANVYTLAYMGDESSLEKLARMIAIKQNQMRGFAT